MHFEYLGEVEGIKHGKTYKAILQSPRADHAEFQKSKKATPKDGLSACCVWLPELVLLRTKTVEFKLPARFYRKLAAA